MLVAIGMLLLLGGIAGAAIGSIAYQTGLRGNLADISIGSLITGLVVLFVAFLLGGWAAGRIARYDGGRNGVMVAVWFLVPSAILAGLGIWLGEEYNVVGRVNLPNWFDAWFSTDDVTTGAVISGIAAVVVALAGGFSEGYGARAITGELTRRSLGHEPGGSHRSDGSFGTDVVPAMAERPDQRRSGPCPQAEDDSITLHEEQLKLGIQTEPYGTVRIRKSVEMERVEQEVPREVEELGDIERIAPSEEDSGEIETLADGSVSIPIFEEELVVTKRLVVRERIVTRKETTEDIERVVADLRREHVSLEADQGLEVEEDRDG
jgi:uncharacterized protein (TIGR02271 family)